MPSSIVSADALEAFANLTKRLEAATSRLEDIASSTIELPQAVPALGVTVASPTSAPKAVTPLETLPESIEDFDTLLNTSVAKYAKISSQLGGLIAEQAAIVVRGFNEERKFLLVTTKAKKPNMNQNDDMEAYQALLRPINETLIAVVNIKESNRGSAMANQLNTVADGVMFLAWVTEENKPHKHVESILESAQFYGNRVLKDNKDKDPQQVEWIQAFLQIFRDLAAYLKQHFPSGIPWNAKGQPVEEVVKSMASSSASSAPAPAPPPPAAGGPPPPPPPGPPPVLKIDEQKNASSGASGGLGAVFSELNKGEAVTKGLRKVDKSEMTHKNPALRAGSTVPESEGSQRGKSPAPGKKPKPESMRAKKPPVKVLEGNKWMIENFDKEDEPIEVEANISHSLLISNCKNSTIVVKGKANAVTVENTNRVNLIVDSLVSSVDVVKSQNFALQVLGQIPTVMMDQIDGAQVYFSKASTSTKIIHSKSAGINLNVISGTDDDYVEVPLPSQMSSYYDAEKGELVDEIVSHAG